MAPPTDDHDPASPSASVRADANGSLSADTASSRDNNDTVGAAADDGAAATALPTVEDMEDLILEAYNNMQSDGEHIFLPSDVASKLHYIAQLVKDAGYTSDDLVSNGSESNQEESARALLPSDQHHTAPPSAASSVPSSPMTPHLSLADDALFPHVSDLRLDQDIEPALTTLGVECKPTEALVLETNNFEPDDDAVAPPIHGAMASHGVADFGPALSPVEEVAEDMLSVSDLDSVAEVSEVSRYADPRDSRMQQSAQDTLTPPKAATRMTTTTTTTAPTREKSHAAHDNPKSHSPEEKPKSMLRKPEVHRKPSVPGRPSSVIKSPDLNKPASSSARPSLATSRLKVDAHAPPTSRERSTSSSYEQRREAAQKLKEEKAQRELQARESARKQREDARRKLEEAQQKEMATKRERVARLRMQKDQRKPPGKSVSATR